MWGCDLEVTVMKLKKNLCQPDDKNTHGMIKNIQDKITILMKKRTEKANAIINKHSSITFDLTNIDAYAKMISDYKNIDDEYSRKIKNCFYKY